MGEIMTKTYSEMVQNMPAIEQMGKWIALSGMFGTKMIDQACVIAMDLFITNMPVREYIKRNSLVMGRPSMPYDAQLAAFRERGGKSKVLSKTPELASIELSIDGVTQTFSLSWEDAKNEPFVYETTKEFGEAAVVDALAAGKPPKLKPKYATPRSRAVMLFARLVSDSIKTMAPEVNFGQYTPEEIEDIPQVFTAPVSRITESPVTTTVATVTTHPVAAIEQQPATETKPVMQVALNEPLRPETKKKILDQMQFLAQNGIPEIKQRVKESLVKNGLERLDDLTIGEGDALLDVLARREIDAWAEQQLKGHKSFS